MPLQLGALRDALLSAGADPQKAEKAAEELAGYESQFADVRADLRLLKWISSINTALILIVIGKLFVH